MNEFLTNCVLVIKPDMSILGSGEVHSVISVSTSDHTDRVYSMRQERLVGQAGTNMT